MNACHLLQAWRRAYKQYTKGVISAETLAEVTASCKGPVSDGGLSTPSDDAPAGRDSEELEAPALAHITVRIFRQTGRKMTGTGCCPVMRHACLPCSSAMAAARHCVLPVVGL